MQLHLLYSFLLHSEVGPGVRRRVVAEHSSAAACCPKFATTLLDMHLLHLLNTSLFNTIAICEGLAASLHACI